MKNMLLLCLLFCIHNVAYAQRGALLYETHCNSCHSTEIHWRGKKLATDWTMLISQVEHWQDSIGLHWSTDEISDVAHYLNERYYGFPEPGHKSLTRDIDHAQSKPE